MPRLQVWSRFSFPILLFLWLFPALEATIHSDVRMRDGEKVVVGTAGFNDKALILVMTARVLK